MNKNKWINYEDVTGEDSNTYECPYCDFVLQLMEGTPEENSYNYCPRCGARLIVNCSSPKGNGFSVGDFIK